MMIRTLLFRFLGVVLLLAAALKLRGFNTNALPHSGILSAPWFQAPIIEWEFLLGAWLISGWRRGTAWLAALATFSVFALVSLRAGWIGLASCGCFGTIRVNPWLVLGIDLGAILLLLASKPPLAGVWAECGQGAARAVRLGGVALLVLVVLALTATLFSNSLTAALAHLRGESMSVSPGVVDVGIGKTGDIVKTQVQIGNWTNHPVRVYGGSSDCSCRTTDDLPIEIPPGETRPVTVAIRMLQFGQFTRRIYFLTDCPSARRVECILTGQCEPAAE